jgi:hypothetical protein
MCATLLRHSSSLSEYPKHLRIFFKHFLTHREKDDDIWTHVNDYPQERSVRFSRLLHHTFILSHYRSDGLVFFCLFIYEENIIQLDPIRTVSDWI